MYVPVQPCRRAPCSNECGGTACHKLRSGHRDARSTPATVFVFYWITLSCNWSQTVRYIYINIGQWMYWCIIKDGWRSITIKLFTNEYLMNKLHELILIQSKLIIFLWNRYSLKLPIRRKINIQIVILYMI